MLTYRSHVYNLAMAVSAEASALSVTLTRCALPEYNNVVGIEEARRAAAALRTAADDLRTAIPEEVVNASWDGNGMSRHLGFIDYHLDENAPYGNFPLGCMGDPVDIAQRDLPRILRCFDEWCERQSPQDNDLTARLAPHIKGNQLNAAVREAWAIFKTRMVNAFGLSSSLDGHRLAHALFDSNGATAGLLSHSDREGYLHLFKGLYTLSRNPAAHNDVQPNPSEIEAVIALVSSAIVKIVNAHRAQATNNVIV